MVPETNSVLLITNRRLDENVGRAEKFATRRRRISEEGWSLEVGYVAPSASGVIQGILRNLPMAREADIINSVSNPPELQIAGGILARLTGTPWLAEFRDPLVTVPGVDRDSTSGRLRARLEQYILTHAAKVIWYDGIQLPDTYFEETYPTVPPDRYTQLPPIGYEQETFQNTEEVSFEQFTITYAGSFYRGWIEPHAFLEGVSTYLERHSVRDSSIQALFYGDWNETYVRHVSELGLDDIVRPNPFVPHDELVGIMKGSDVLLYIGGDDPRNKGNLPTKLYDYIGASRPILALVDPSFRVAETIEAYDLGIVVPPGDADAIATALAELRDDYTFRPTLPDGMFTRERSTAVYVETLREILHDS